MNFVKMLWRGLRRNREQPPLVLLHRGGGMLEKPTAAGETQNGSPPP